VAHVAEPLPSKGKDLSSNWTSRKGK
jgi:hypothetical protein